MSKIKIKVASSKVVEHNGRKFKIFSAVGTDGVWYTVKFAGDNTPKLERCGFIIVDADKVNTVSKKVTDKDGHPMVTKKGEQLIDRSIWIKGEYEFEEFPPEDFSGRFDTLE